MESRLPKPSALKRPMPISRTILPIDRIKSAGFGSKSSQLLSNSTASLYTSQPLTTNLSNIQSVNNPRERAASPEAARSNTHVRAKLRRSRSACDIRDMRPIKRMDSTLAPIPAKTSRLMSTTVANSNRPQRIATNNNNTISGTCTNNTVKRQTSRPATTAQTTTGTKKTATNAPSSATAVSTTGAGKPINKRIPPYDFKARYNDLLEKHKILKEKFEEKCQQFGTLESLPEQLEETQSQLITTQDELRNTQTIKGCLEEQVKMQTKKIESIEESLSKTQEELDKLLKIYNKLKLEHAEITTEVLELRERSTDLAERNEGLLKEIEICKEQLFRSNMERKELHNTVMDLRGNIRVFCRVRPPLECELDKQLCGWNYLDEATVEIVNYDKNKANAHTFSFDQVFHPVSAQESIFEMVSPLIQSALDGYNICIFAYGQTGSGKTYTMDGISSNPGVIPRTVDLLFDSIKNYRHLGWEYEIKVTFLEIYNEVLYDLLSNEQKEMEIRMVKNSKNDIYVSNITQETVESAARLRQLMNIAKMNRATAATVGNERSSRSHAVTKIELIGTHAEKQEISIGSINLVDLAGSESPKTSTRMNETKNINRSLSELTNVILALLQKQDHIPYRNSKLTHLLMPSLGGNSKTLMFINVAPFQDCFVESVKSLRFAATVNQCKMAKAKRNRILNNSALGNCSTISN
ncbi:Protein claret segregational [Lucilia cuprina]|uniref:Kinesin-like protein n=1 Tax=Lucilia cuprina TaxID=7375 RepID=A0A0L0BYK3_LUCCU|nr:Protein claret segregational [Lucilia cuprina]KNC25056.1 Protein claret segregational [Lucilia cuprina]